jgi:hypothetical protein
VVANIASQRTALARRSHAGFKMHRAFILTLALVTLISRVAHAEVMDKEPTLLQTWALSRIGGGLAFGVARFRWWLGAIIGVLPTAYFLGLWQEVHDPFVGPAIRSEAGASYVWSSAIATLVWIGLAGTGVIAGFRRRRPVTG